MISIINKNVPINIGTFLLNEINVQHKNRAMISIQTCKKLSIILYKLLQLTIDSI